MVWVSVALGCLVGLTACTLDPSGVGGGSSTVASGGVGGQGATGAGAAGGLGGFGGVGGEGGRGGQGGQGGGGGQPAHPPSCASLPGGSPNGVYTVDPTGDPPDDALDVYCDTVSEGGGWALVLSSVGMDGGPTFSFWQIPYADRLLPKGQLDPDQNYYDGRLYVFGQEFRDEVVDIDDALFSVLTVSVQGFDTTTMTFQGATVTSPPPPLDGTTLTWFGNHFSGWSAPGNDFDTDPANCAEVYLNVTQHYGGCWTYNLGASDPPSDDGGWGPHMIRSAALALGLSTDAAPTNATRVNKVRRWARW